MPAQCPSHEQLEALLANHLAEAELVSLAEHLASCEACRQRLEELAGGTDWLPGKLPGLAGPETRPSAHLRAVMDQLRPLANVPGQTPATDADAASLDFLSPSGQPGDIGRFGPYEIIEEIARGGMGIVLKARDPALDRIVAIKVLAPALASNPGARLRFLREARAAAAISHEHVVDIHAVDEANGLPYLVMQFVSGQSLAQRIRATGPLKLEEILRIGTQIASGLAAAHAQGLIHRDIKPANILLENGVERVKITDFGLARTVDEISTTQSGMLAGTPEFMAPEQARGEPVDHRADLFSLGCVLYCMATGESPFAGSTLLSVIRKVCDEEARPVCEANPALPGWFGEVVGQLLAKDPAQRLQSAQQVAGTLEAHLARVQRSSQPPVPADEPMPGGGDQEIPSPPPPRWTRRRRVTVVSLGVAGFVMLALFLAYVATRPPRASTQGAFQVLGKEGKATRAFSTLAEAVRAAHSGETIEVNANGPFEIEPVVLGDKALTIRAAPGSHPVLVTPPRTAPLLMTEALLVLEGLEFVTEAGGPDRSGRRVARGRPSPAVSSSGAPLFMANCRFQGPPAVLLTNVPHGELRNCEIYTKADCGVTWVCNAAPPPGLDSTNAALRLVMENCVQRGDTLLSLDHQAPTRAAISLLRNTVTPRVVLVLPTLEPKPGLRIFAGTNVFNPHTFFQRGARPGTADLKGLLSWEDHHNVIAISFSFNDRELGTTGPQVRDLMAWNRYWNQTNSRSVQLSLGLGAALKPTRLESPTVRNFELPSSDYDRIAAAGGDRSIPYGAALELVGPGQAYDTWRRSPEYQQWQERIERLRSRRPQHVSGQGNRQ